MKRILFGLVISACFANVGFAQSKEPDLQSLSQSGFVMGPGNGSYPISETWQRYVNVMKSAATFDRVVKEVENVVCGPAQNKSVLLIGEPNEFYKYIFARIASRAGSDCNGLWHVEIDENKIESGHRYVGDVDEYWNKNILDPADRKNVVLYLNSLGGLIGIGSHANDDTGIEREYASNISSGRLRSVAFMDKFDYNETSRSKHAYVIESFATKIILPPVEQAEAAELVRSYLSALHPNLILADDELNYLLKMGAFYLPNRPEPERSMSIINKMINGAGGAGKELKNNSVTIETAHPYAVNANLTWEVNYPDANELQLSFDFFETEKNYDNLFVRDMSGNTLDIITGSLGAHKSKFYGTNHLILNFKSDTENVGNGFKISTVIGATYKAHQFTLEETRNAVMTVAQVPQWLIDRDFSIIKNLKAKLDEDVVGVTEGKIDAVRLARNGYVAGRTDDKPIATMMLAGPTGTGKSYIAKKLADFTGQRLITIDMTSYKEPSSFKTFQEVVARNLTNTPYAVYLFEEIDKAAVEVLDQLYFMMDEGVFYDQYQRPLFARGAFILMTTNAASDTILTNPKSPDLRKLVMDDLGKHFRASFLNRFDAVSIFLPFSDAEYNQLAHVLIDKKIAKMKEFYNWTMSLDAGSYDYVGWNGRSEKFGARPMERLVESVLGGGIAEYQLEVGIIPEKAKIQLSKLSGANLFKLVVNGKSVNFEVDPSNNGINMFWKMKQLPLQQFFKGISLYND
jgi:ATP-dependent Clp protease ATP-binding subunit ClpA